MCLISKCQLLLEFGWGRGAVKSIGYVLISIIILYRWWRFRINRMCICRERDLL